MKEQEIRDKSKDIAYFQMLVHNLYDTASRIGSSTARLEAIRSEVYDSARSLDLYLDELKSEIK